MENKYIIKDAIFNKTNMEQDPMIYYQGKDGHVWTIAHCAEGWKRKCDTIKHVKAEQVFTQNTKFTTIDEDTYTYWENDVWFHVVFIMEVKD